jgi:hypothetical protein
VYIVGIVDIVGKFVVEIVEIVKNDNFDLWVFVVDLYSVYDYSSIISFYYLLSLYFVIHNYITFLSLYI